MENKDKKSLNWPLAVIVFISLVVTGLAAWKLRLTPAVNQKDSWDFYLWFTPLGYLILAILFGGIRGLNKPISVVYAAMAYGLSAFLLFLGSNIFPPEVQWHYPIGAAAIVYVLYMN